MRRWAAVGVGAAMAAAVGFFFLERENSPVTKRIQGRSSSRGGCC